MCGLCEWFFISFSVNNNSDYVRTFTISLGFFAVAQFSAYLPTHRFAFNAIIMLSMYVQHIYTDTRTHALHSIDAIVYAAAVYYVHRLPTYVRSTKYVYCMNVIYRCATSIQQRWICVWMEWGERCLFWSFLSFTLIHLFIYLRFDLCDGPMTCGDYRWRRLISTTFSSSTSSSLLSSFSFFSFIFYSLASISMSLYINECVCDYHRSFSLVPSVNAQHNSTVRAYRKSSAKVLLFGSRTDFTFSNFQFKSNKQTNEKCRGQKWIVSCVRVQCSFCSSIVQWTSMQNRWTFTMILWSATIRFYIKWPIWWIPWALPIHTKIRVVELQLELQTIMISRQRQRSMKRNQNEVLTDVCCLYEKVFAVHWYHAGAMIQHPRRVKSSNLVDVMATETISQRANNVWNRVKALEMGNKNWKNCGGAIDFYIFLLFFVSMRNNSDFYLFCN